MQGWDNLTPTQQQSARDQYAAHVSARQTPSGENAPKRIRQGQPTRLRQMQLAFGVTPALPPAPATGAAVAAATAAPGQAPGGVQGLGVLDAMDAALTPTEMDTEDTAPPTDHPPIDTHAHALPVEQDADEDSDLDDPFQPQQVFE